MDECRARCLGYGTLCIECLVAGRGRAYGVGGCIRFRCGAGYGGVLPICVDHACMTKVFDIHAA